MLISLFLVLLGCQQPAASPRPPIIDIHLHATILPSFTDTTWFPRGLARAESNDALRRMTLDEMRRYNVVKGVVNDYPSLIRFVRRYRAEDPTRIIGGLQWGDVPESIDSIPKWLTDGTVQVLGEITAQYAGVAPADPVLEPIWQLAERFDTPVGIHMGPGALGGASIAPLYRVRLSNALLLEDVLARHPRLRLYVMHAGWPFGDEMVALLHHYPNVYVDIAFIDWYIPRAEFYSYLKRLVDAGYGKRIMFGSDQIQWPGAIGAAIAAIDEAPFLSTDQRRDLYCRNAARFLRLDGQLCGE